MSKSLKHYAVRGVVPGVVGALLIQIPMLFLVNVMFKAWGEEVYLSQWSLVFGAVVFGFFVGKASEKPEVWKK